MPELEGKVMKVLLISPFGYAIKQKSKEIKTILKKQKVAAFIDEVIAMPDDINKRLKGKQYDYCYADTEYNSDEIAVIREHIQGKQLIERF